jgi:hypothetical protein
VPQDLEQRATPAAQHEQAFYAAPPSIAQSSHQRFCGTFDGRGFPFMTHVDRGSPLFDVEKNPNLDLNQCSIQHLAYYFYELPSRSMR